MAKNATAHLTDLVEEFKFFDKVTSKVRPSLKCPICRAVLDIFVLTERGRCATCGADTEDFVKLIWLMKKNLSTIQSAIVHATAITDVNVFGDKTVEAFTALVRDRLNFAPRGDRRTKSRKKPNERRDRTRTPGRFKAAVDSVHITERKGKK